MHKKKHIVFYFSFNVNFDFPFPIISEKVNLHEIKMKKKPFFCIFLNIKHTWSISLEHLFECKPLDFWRVFTFMIFRIWFVKCWSLEENHITYYTLNRWALILKTVSFHDLSFSSPLAGRASNGGPKHLRGRTNRGKRQFFSKSWREGSIYLYVMWRKWSSMIWKDPFSLLIGMILAIFHQLYTKRKWSKLICSPQKNSP